MHGDRVASAKFGGDFYTEIHDATRAAAGNVSSLIYNVGKMYRDFCVAFGIAMILISAFKLCDVIKNMKG